MKPHLFHLLYIVCLIQKGRGGNNACTILLRWYMHCHHNGFDAVCRSTVNLAFLRLQPKITRIQKIQQGTKNEGKWKEARQLQTKKWLIMLNRLPEDK